MPELSQPTPVTDVAWGYPLVTNGLGRATDFRWVAVWTKPRAEKVVAAALASRLDHVWLPQIRVRRRWSDRWKEVDLPLFPNYLFASIPERDWPTLLRVPGVLTVVKHGTRPAWLHEHQIIDLRIAVDALASGDVEPELVDDYEPGDRVRVISGPMAGLRGVVREVRGGRRLLVGVEQIGKAIALSIGAADLERCDS